MSFYITGVNNENFELNGILLEKVKKREFSAYGLSIFSDAKIDGQMLVFSTEIKYVAISNRDVVHEVAGSSYTATFHMDSLAILKQGVTAESLKIIEKCYHLAQAQSYAVYCILAKEKGIPQSGMEVTPRENYIEGLKDILKENQFPQN